MITVSKVNETYIRVAADRGILQELSDYFQFDVPGARWTPKFKAKLWDGKIRLFNMNTSHLYTGLLPALKIFAENNEYPIAIDARLASQTTATLDQVKDYVDSLNLYGHGEKLIARDYQYDAILNAVNKERIFLLSPTACLSGSTIIGAEVTD